MENFTGNGDLNENGISPSFFNFVKYTTMYLQPVIFTVGLIGNFISLCVFLSQSMRKISSNLYLAGKIRCNSIIYQLGNMLLVCL